ncbi:MAG: GNAT family N-acetyltransferase [Candidatus Eisenbacteria bacterium]
MSGLEIRTPDGEDEIRDSIEIMVSSEPWITLGRTRDEAAAILKSDKREAYVAVLDGSVVGFIVLVLRGLVVGFIQSIAVRSDLRSRGVGRALMEFAESRIFEDYPNVFLAVSSFNTDARRFYERLGYEEVGELRDLLVRGHSEVLLRKTTGPISEFESGKRLKAQSS